LRLPRGRSVPTVPPTASTPRPPSTTVAGSAGGGKTATRVTRHRTRHHTAPVVTVDAVRGPSWVVIRARYSGPVLYRGILVQGHRITVRGKAVWAQIGAVGNVDVRFRRSLVRLGHAALTGVILTAQGPVATQPGSAGIVGS
jgi:hypothetical protein